VRESPLARMPYCCLTRATTASFAMTSSFTGMVLSGALAFRAVPAGATRSAALARLAERILPDSAPLIRSLVSENFERVVYLGSKEFKGLARESGAENARDDGWQRWSPSQIPPSASATAPRPYSIATPWLWYNVSNDEYTRQYDLDLVSELRPRRRGRTSHHVIRAPRSAVTPGTTSTSLLPGIRPMFSISKPACPTPCLPSLLALASLDLSGGSSLDNPTQPYCQPRVKGVSIHPWRGTGVGQAGFESRTSAGSPAWSGLMLSGCDGTPGRTDNVMTRPATASRRNSLTKSKSYCRVYSSLETYTTNQGGCD